MKIELKKAAQEIREILEKRRQEIELTFIEEDHIYYMRDLEGNVKSDFPSVSKVMKLFYDEFPAEEISFKKAKGDLEVQQQLLGEWKAAADYSINIGSRTHFLLEKKSLEINGIDKEVRQPIFDCDFEQILKSDSMVSAGTDFLHLMEKRGAVLLDTELILGSPELGYVGAPDKMWLIMNKENSEIGLVVSDYKTNKPKNFEPNHFTKPMRAPFQKHPNNALGHYFTQLPFYAKLLLDMLKGSKYEDIKLLGCIIVLVKDDGSYEEFRVPKEVITTILDMDMSNYLTTLKK